MHNILLCDVAVAMVNGPVFFSPLNQGLNRVIGIFSATTVLQTLMNSLKS